jgi:hypothetical protein
VVVHFQDKAFVPEWKATGNFLACTWKVTNKVLGRGHDKIRKWVKTMYCQKARSHRENFSPQRQRELET